MWGGGGGGVGSNNVANGIRKLLGWTCWSSVEGFNQIWRPLLKGEMRSRNSSNLQTNTCYRFYGQRKRDTKSKMWGRYMYIRMVPGWKQFVDVHRPCCGYNIQHHAERTNKGASGRDNKPWPGKGPLFYRPKARFRNADSNKTEVEARDGEDH